MWNQEEIKDLPFIIPEMEIPPNEHTVNTLVTCILHVKKYFTPTVNLFNRNQ